MNPYTTWLRLVWWVQTNAVSLDAARAAGAYARSLLAEVRPEHGLRRGEGARA